MRLARSQACDGSAVACAGLSEAVAAARAVRPQQVRQASRGRRVCPLCRVAPGKRPHPAQWCAHRELWRCVCVWQVLLVGMTCSIGDHAATNRRLRRLWTHPKPGLEPLDIQLAHDGLVLHLGQ